MIITIPQRVADIAVTHIRIVGQCATSKEECWLGFDLSSHRNPLFVDNPSWLHVVGVVDGIAAGLGISVMDLLSHLGFNSEFMLRDHRDAS